MLIKEDTGLIIVDIQGKLARLVSDSDSLIAHCQKLIKGAKVLGLPIVWLEQNPEKLGRTVEELRPLLDQQEPIFKFTFDACEEDRFIQAISVSGRNSWLICGIEAHVCVYQTSLHLKKLDYDVHLVGDCISSRKRINKDLATTKLIQHGVSVTGLEMCLFELVKDCRSPEFKEILDLVK